MSTVTLPDIGDFADVEVIEILVAVGDEVTAEQALLTLESDKASIEIPSPTAGTVEKLLINIGDKLSQGDAIMEISEATPAAAKPASTEPEPAKPEPAKPESESESAKPESTPAAASSSAPAGELDCDIVVLGAGPGGYSAAFRAADLGLKVALVERYSTLGGVCLNVGCIPSKALLHVAAVMDEVAHMGALGVKYPAPEVDLDALRAHKDGVVAKLTGGLAGMAKARKVQVVHGTAHFTGANALHIQGDDTAQPLRFRYAIIAAGSQSVALPFLPDDPRIIDSTGALALKDVPERMLVIGGGIIGLEMATVYSTLGSSIDVVEMLDTLMPGADADLVKIWQQYNAKRFNALKLGTKTIAAKATEQGIEVQFEKVQDASDTETQTYDAVLVAVGRSPNGGRIGAEAAGVQVDERGFIGVDAQMRSNVPHIFAIGDLVGQPMLAHKAVHEAHVAAEVIAGEIQNDDALRRAAFDPMQIPSVAYTDPEVAWTGKTEAQCKAEGIAYDKGVFPWAASGRAIANGRDEGMSKLIFEKESGRIIGGGIVGTHAGDMIGEVSLAIEMGADMIDIGKTIHPHPTLGESLGMAAEVAHGTCTDLPAQKKR